MTVIIKIIAILLLLVSKSFAQTATISVEITGFSNNKGQVIVGLYNTESTFLKKPYKGIIEKIENNRAKVVFKNIPIGEYAISLFHDENKNEKIDTNFVGIPKEDYGVSNNNKGFMGPPKYKDAKFLLEKDKVILIKL